MTRLTYPEAAIAMSWVRLDAEVSDDIGDVGRIYAGAIHCGHWLRPCPVIAR